MTQKETILAELIREPTGLTSADLRERTGLPDASLRTNIWSMRKAGWIEPVAGGRGRLRYGITREGRRHASSRPKDHFAETFSHAYRSAQAALWPEDADLKVETASRRQLLRFARWLVTDRKDLLVAGGTDVQARLEDAVADFLYQAGREDVLELLTNFSATDPQDGGG